MSRTHPGSPLARPHPSGRCAHHPDVQAVAICPRCGDYACGDCFGPAGDRCLECSQRTSEGPQVFHAVSPLRFLLFTVLTAGWYPTYWSYRTWVGIRDRDGSRLWPAARALFMPVTTWLLVAEVVPPRLRPTAGDRGIAWATGLYCLGGLLIVLGSPWAELGALRPLLLLPLLLAMRRASPMRVVESLDRWRPRHALLLPLGALLWGLTFGIASAAEDREEARLAELRAAEARRAEEWMELLEPAREVGSGAGVDAHP